MRRLATLQLIAGVAYALIIYSLFVIMAGIAEPVPGARFVLYWGSLSVAPLLVIAGAVLTLAGRAPRLAARLIVVGAGVLCTWTAWELRNIPHDVANGTFGVDGLFITLTMIALATTTGFVAIKLYKRAAARENAP